MAISFVVFNMTSDVIFASSNIIYIGSFISNFVFNLMLVGSISLALEMIYFLR